MRAFDYARPADLAEARALLHEDGARPLGGGTDLLPAQDRGIRPARRLVDLRGLGLDRIDERDGALAIGATATVADVARDERVRSRYGVLAEAARSAASPQLREMGTVGGNLCQAVRCWYFRHPDLRCWLRGGDTCYAQIGDHRRHALEPGDCISVAPSDLSAALAALDAQVVTSERRMPLLELYRRPSGEERDRLALRQGEIVVEVVLPHVPDASAYARAGERAAWSFANAAVAAARFGDDVRMAAIGVANVVRPLDPADPLAGLPGLPMSRWKRRLLEGLVAEALEGVTG